MPHGETNFMPNARHIQPIVPYASAISLITAPNLNRSAPNSPSPTQHAPCPNLSPLTCATRAQGSMKPPPCPLSGSWAGGPRIMEVTAERSTLEGEEAVTSPLSSPAQ